MNLVLNEPQGKKLTYGLVSVLALTSNQGHTACMQGVHTSVL
jgi:hypothetical protein